MGYPPLPEGVLAIDGPAALPWEQLARSLPRCRTIDIRRTSARPPAPAATSDS